MLTKIVDGVEELCTPEEAAAIKTEWALNAIVTPDQMRRNISIAIQKSLDAKAQELRYDNIMSARSYAGYVNPFQPEALALANWSADCWVKAGEIEAAVRAGSRSMPTVGEALSEMPVFSVT